MCSGAHEGQDPVPPFMAVLFLGLTGAILRSHFSGKLPLKLKGLSWIQGPMQALCTEEHFIPGMI